MVGADDYPQQVSFAEVGLCKDSGRCGLVRRCLRRGRWMVVALADCEKAENVRDCAFMRSLRAMPAYWTTYLREAPSPAASSYLCARFHVAGAASGGAAFPACAPIAPAFLILGLPGRALAGSAGGPGCLPAGARFPARSGNGGDVVQGPRGALVAAPGFQRARPVACLPFSPIHGPASPALGGISPALPRQVGCLAGPSWRAYVRFVRAWPLPDCDEALASSLLFLSPTAGRPGCVIVSSFVVGVCASKGAPAVRFLLCASELSVWFVSSNEKL